MKKVVVAGTRTLDNDAWVISTLDKLYNFESVTILSGTATGADKAGEKWAELRNVMVRRYPPDYKTYKRGAPLVRNSHMADDGDALVLFWNGKSRGSRDMLEKAYKAGMKEIHVYRY